MGDAEVVGGRYEIVRLVGAGAMGRVYEARDQQTQRRVAIKMLKLERGDDDLPARFDREILATAQITSRHVVSVHDAGRTDTGEPYMVMDFLDGEDLGVLVERLRIVPMDLALRIAAQVCDGLIAAHAVGVVHRDIKPSNLFLVAPTASATRIVKILDFGVARLRMSGLEGDVTELTRTGSLIGSPLYMAPEQLRGVKDLDHRADVWSLGVVLYRMLCGTVPQARESVADLLITVCSTPAPALRDRAPWLPKELGQMVHHALAIDAAARIPSARAFADELARWLPKGSAITAEMITPTEVAEIRSTGSSDIDPSLVMGEVVGTPRPRSAVRGRAVARSLQQLAMPTHEPDHEPARAVRPSLLVALGITGAIAIGTLVYLQLRAKPTDQPEITAASDELPPALANTDGAAWFARVRERCNSLQVRGVLADTPPPASIDGAAFAAACASIAGDLRLAQKQIAPFPKDQHAYGVWPAFEIAHRMADKRPKDPAVAAIMRFVLDSWPDNYMALYHAGIAEFAAGDVPRATKHLQGFLKLYSKRDGFSTTATNALAELANPTTDCSHPIGVDGEGTALYPQHCK